MLRFSILSLACLLAACGDNLNNPDMASIDANMTIDASDAAITCGCPTLNPGDIFTVCGPSEDQRLIIDPQGEVMYFATEAVFESWRPSDQQMPSISQNCLDGLDLPNNLLRVVSFRPGSYVVKREWSLSQLDVILPHNTAADISLQMAATLYGVAAYPGGADNIPVEIIEPHWKSLIHAAPEITGIHPGLLFVIAGSDGTTYYADPNGTRRVVTDLGFTANYFQKKFVRQVPSSFAIGMPVGDQITTYEEAISDPTQGGN